MNLLYSYIALDLARDRAREADEARRAALAAIDLPVRPGLARRSLATGLALVARVSAAAVRRLDACVADDLHEALATSK